MALNSYESRRATTLCYNVRIDIPCCMKEMRISPKIGLCNVFKSIYNGSVPGIVGESWNRPRLIYSMSGRIRIQILDLAMKYQNNISLQAIRKNFPIMSA